MRLTCLVPHPLAGASTRYRVHQFLPRLRERGVEVRVEPLLDEAAFARLYRAGGFVAKAADWAAAFARRRRQVRSIGPDEVVLVHREIWPLRSLVLERELAARSARWVFDLDDAVFLPNVSRANRAWGFLKAPDKSAWIVGHSAAVAAGNRFLGEWAERHRPAGGRVFHVPTAVDTDTWSPGAARAAGEVVLGWIGTHSTIGYLEPLRPVLEELGRRHPGLRLRVIGADFALEHLAVERVPWTLEGEVESLRAIDIGLSPLPDTDWARGKCGLKLLQYLALAKAAVASPVGANRDIVEDGEHGLWAERPEEWLAALSRLVEDEPLRRRLGDSGRRRVEEEYSVAAVEPRLFAALQHAHDGERP